MSKRICLMSFYPTDCKEDCYNCKCGGAEATKNMYVSIHNVQRVCSITGGAADTDEGEYIAEVIRNNLENMVIPASDVQPVKRGKWEEELYNDCFHCYRAICSECGGESTDFYSITDTHNFCEYCGARMTKDGDIE